MTRQQWHGAVSLRMVGVFVGIALVDILTMACRACDNISCPLQQMWCA